MSMKTSLSCYNVLEIGRTNNSLITNKNLLKLCCFASFTFVIPEVYIPVSPGSGFTYFLLTATQPRLSTGIWLDFSSPNFLVYCYQKLDIEIFFPKYSLSNSYALKPKYFVQ